MKQHDNGQPSRPVTTRQDNMGQSDEELALSQTLQGSVYRPASEQTDPTGVEMGLARSYDQGGAGYNLIDLIFDTEGTRKHRQVLNHNRQVTIETLEALNQASLINTDFVANSLETEASFEQSVRRHRDSKLALNSAPVYIQQARQMQMQTGAAIAQVGQERIKNKIERR